MSIGDESSESRTSPPWQDRTVLKQLYVERNLSLRQIADELGCHRDTVHKWATELGIELRPANDQKLHPSASTNPKGYTYFSSQIGDERDHVSQHELVAILSGADPADVFDSETQVHHRLRLPGSFRVPQLDIPGNLEVMEAYEHLSGHQTGTHDEPSLEQVLEDNRD